ncbi:META domain-containing protein [Streptomyces sp. NBC_01281]|uniref:META domain-containing protein n=1 Tax=Streptomyces sp. NBC_01281 TaxID=2903811 RepID=UPI002E0F3D77|nr:META domain-containing protein [Streptomyces sp. NBC_01281]
MDKQRMTLSVLTLLPLAVACGTQTAGSGSVGTGSPVTGVHWTVDSLTVDGRTAKAPAGAYLKIGEDGRASGNLGCNGFGSKATVEGDRVAFGALRTTEMGCAKGPTAFERNLSRSIAGQDGFTARTDGDRLTLTADSGDWVSLTKEKDAPLRGTKWTVTALGDRNTSRSLPKGTDAYFVLSEKGTLDGRLGCNHASARATVSDGHITLGPARTTRMMCDRSLMRTEKALLELFDGRTSYAVDHRGITLTSGNGTIIQAVATE